MRRLHLWLIAGLLVFAPSLTGAQQLVEEDLPEPEVWEEVVPSFAEAEQIFNSANQPDSLVLFDAFLRQVEENRVLEEPPDMIYDLVAKSYFFRAQVNHNLGSTELVELDLEQLLEIDPGFLFDRALVSGRLAEQFDTMKKERVATILVAVDPPDAAVSVGPWNTDPSGLLEIPTGIHIIHAEKAGYESQDLEVEVAAGDAQPLPILLERTSAVLIVATSIEDVEIFLDGANRGSTLYGSDTTQGALLVLDGLQPGGYELSARKESFRESLVSVQIEDLLDYNMASIQLVPTSGVVALNNMPPGTVIRANGNLVSPSFSGSGVQVALSPGGYTLSLAHPDRGLFEARVDIIDQQAVEIDVRLRPPLVLLGILGGDTSTATRMNGLLSTELGELGSWALIDRSGVAEEIVAAAGLDVATLRAYAQTGSRQTIPWIEIQKEAGDRAEEGSVYMLGVLSDDLLAETVHMFLFPESPLPARPDQVDLALDSATVRNLAALLNHSVLESRPTLGAIVVDSPAAAGPLVVQTSEGGPAQQAGLTSGDEILSIDGTTVATVSDFWRELTARVETHATSGRLVPLRVASPGGERDVQLALTTSPSLIELGATDVLYSVASYELSTEDQNEEGVVPKWVVRLNQAVVYLHGGDLQGAIQMLRSIDAPTGGRLGEAQVNYLLGLALSSAGGEYASTASGFLTRAAEGTDGRLYHADGPLIAPRAKVRLRVLN
ncbi:MAG: PDZ domain-containing protein [Acidobacteriota bacterium]|nr:PDZ domain-containing protein [Acidobacteriota bacterium]